MTRLLPGIGLAATAAAALLAAAPALTTAAPVLSPLVIALLLGAVTGSVLGATARRASWASRVLGDVTPGATWTARHALRTGVVLLGLQLSVGDVLDLGWRGLVVVAVTVAVTFTGTLALGRWLRVAPETALLVATGFSICGAAAVSAMSGVVDRSPRRAGADDERSAAVAVALAMVALYGTLAVVVLPWLAALLGLSPGQAGLWIGASVQEVAQVVAAAGTVAGTAALATATVAKLARVVLLAPLVTTVGAVRARRVALAAPGARTGSTAPGAPTTAPAPSGTPPRTAPRRTAPVPGFVAGFLVAVVVRSLGIVPDGVLDVAASLTTALLVAAMFALGLGVDVPRLVRTGRRPLLLGACSAVVVTGTSLVGVVLLVP